MLYLGEQDFYISQGTKGLVVCCRQNGIQFVMFHADPGVCQYCELAKPEFVQLEQFVAGVKFGLCNLSKARGLYEKSTQTITPLQKVPMFILFVNGRPFINYTGEHKLKHFAEFLQQMTARLQNQQVFGEQGMQTMSAEMKEKTAFGIPYDYDYESVSDASNVGNIVCDDKGCYLTHKDLYGGGDEQPKPAQQSNMMNPQVLQQQAYHPPAPAPVQVQQQPQPRQQYQPQQYQQPYYPPAQPQYQQPYYPPVQQQQQAAYYPPPQPQYQQPQYQQQYQYRPPQSQQQQAAYYPPPQQPNRYY
jgi:hypothetical protein